MKKTVLITGATGSIGKATALELAGKGCAVILMGRNAEKLAAVKSEISKLTGNNEISTLVADLSEPESIRNAVNEFKKWNNSLQALIHVAAIFRKDKILNSNGLEYMFATNHLGPFLLTNTLMDALKNGKPSRVVVVSAPSTTSVNFDDLNGEKKFNAGFLGAFGASKMMNIMFTYSLARRIEGSGVTCSVFHPGLVKSELTREMPKFLYHLFKLISSPPDKAAKMLCSLAIDEQYQFSNGLFFNSAGKNIQSNTYSYNQELQEKLWTMSEKLVEVQ